jgi:hypothetical protein
LAGVDSGLDLLAAPQKRLPHGTRMTFQFGNKLQRFWSENAGALRGDWSEQLDARSPRRWFLNRHQHYPSRMRMARERWLFALPMATL